MSHFSLSGQIKALVAAFVIASIAAVTGLSYSSEASSSQLRKLLTETNRVSQSLFDLIEAVGKAQSVSQKLVREKDPDVLEKLVSEQKSAVSLAEARIGEAHVEKTDVGSAYHTLVKANDQAAETVMRGEYAQAQELLIEQSNPAFEALLKGMARAQQESQRTMDVKTALVVEGNSRARMITYLVLASVLVALVVLAGLALRAINARLRSNMQELRSSAEQMTSAAQMLARGASSQADALESAAASSAEINSVTPTNAGDSEAAARLTQKSAEAVVDANGRLKQLQLSMRDISDSSGKVSKINELSVLVDGATDRAA